ncbi:MAG: hypothetical protein HCAMLNBO_01384 [Candidatus Brocadia fulgida]|nr:hypothetical protein [Candidatus Brocadia fulgida]
MIRNGLCVNLRHAAFLTPYHAGKVAEVIDCQGQIGRQGLTYRLAVFPCLRNRKFFEVCLHPVCNFEKDIAPFSNRYVSPLHSCFMRLIQGKFNILFFRSRNLRKGFSVHRRNIFKIFSTCRSNPFSADIVVI